MEGILILSWKNSVLISFDGKDPKNRQKNKKWIDNI